MNLKYDNLFFEQRYLAFYDGEYVFLYLPSSNKDVLLYIKTRSISIDRVIFYGYFSMGIFLWVFFYGYFSMGIFLWVFFYGYFSMGIFLWVFFYGYFSMGIFLWVFFYGYLIDFFMMHITSGRSLRIDNGTAITPKRDLL